MSLPPGFRPLDEFLAWADEINFEKRGIHWFLLKGRLRSRLRRRELLSRLNRRPLHWLCRLMGHRYVSVLAETPPRERQECWLCGRRRRVV